MVAPDASDRDERAGKLIEELIRLPGDSHYCADVPGWKPRSDAKKTVRDVNGNNENEQPIPTSDG